VAIPLAMSLPNFKIVNSLKALGSERRISIINHIKSRDRTMLEISRLLKISDSTASYHLRKLVREEYLTVERHGKETRFSLSPRLRESKLLRQIQSDDG